MKARGEGKGKVEWRAIVTPHEASGISPASAAQRYFAHSFLSSPFIISASFSIMLRNSPVKLLVWTQELLWGGHSCGGCYPLGHLLEVVVMAQLIVVVNGQATFLILARHGMMFKDSASSLELVHDFEALWVRVALNHVDLELYAAVSIVFDRLRTHVLYRLDYFRQAFLWVILRATF